MGLDEGSHRGERYLVSLVGKAGTGEARGERMAGEKEGDVEMSAVPEGQHQRGESLGQSIRGAAAAVLGAEQMRALEDPSLINSTRGSVLGGSFGSKVHIAGASRSLVSSLRNPEDGSIRENITELHPEDGQADYGPARVSNWWNTSFIIMAEIMGTGILSLPSTMAGLGYILGSVAIVVMAAAVYFQGFLLAKVKNRYYSQALSYGDLAYILNGGAFEKFTRGLLYANWFALLCYYILALTSSLMSAFYFSGPTCFWEWGLIAVACLVPFAQVRRRTRGFAGPCAVLTRSLFIVLISVANVSRNVLPGHAVHLGHNRGRRDHCSCFHHRDHDGDLLTGHALGAPTVIPFRLYQHCEHHLRVPGAIRVL